MNTEYFMNQIMGNVFGTKTSPTLPSKYYIGLSKTEPTVAGVCTGEPSTSGTGYSRVLLNNLSAPSKGIIKNTSAISFNESILDWGVMKYYVVYDAQSGGNLLFFGDLSMQRTVEPNTVVTIKTGELSIELSNPTN